jgi:preprotein translocase subunit SecF
MLLDGEHRIPSWVLTVFILAIVVLAIVLIVIFLIEHSFIAGLLIGLVLGIGGTLIAPYVIRWFKAHRVVKVVPPEE